VADAVSGAAADDRRVVVAADAGAAADAAAAHLRRLLAAAVERRGAAWIALAGGRTPRALYERLAAAGEPSIAWPRIHVAFGDERLVPPDHADSNYGMARAALLGRVAVPPAQVYRIRGELAKAVDAAAVYARDLARAMPLAAAAWPIFDVVLLGLGADGHTASLFPGTATLGVADRIAADASAPAAPVARVTLTFPVLNSARAVVVLASGADKADAVARAFDETVAVHDCPIRGVRPAAGTLTWHLDAAAASKLMDDRPPVTPP
jgi:6-phosphogluconolactonase